MLDTDTNEYSIEISALWSQAEELLKSFRCPYAVRILLEKPAGNSGIDKRMLAWRRFDNSPEGNLGWHIVYEVSYRIREDEAIALINAPLAIRMEMIDHFNELRTAVIMECEKMIPRLDKAIAEFKRILDTCKE